MAEKFRLMPNILYDGYGRSYILQKTTTQYFFEDREYRTVGTYTHDRSASGNTPQAPPKLHKRPAWEQGLLRCKEADKKWKEELETRRRGSRGPVRRSL